MDSWPLDELCPKCGHNDLKAQKWGDGDVRICCSFCSSCWLEGSTLGGLGSSGVI